ncbi:helix-turn-helix domain-containing protein [Blautia sp. XA-2221]|uniref:helix-turn-helix domain-containing protein n=1 Tax=Blautia sp. XA-2221 TaxID=2903961 RepID=UPI002379A37F|nr:helix-turn-helix transcriptional regulator [Blautia sp. XA-2221]
MEYNRQESKQYNYLIGQKIKEIRNKRDLKQEYVAEKLGVSNGHYSNIENGRKTCTLQTLIQLCEILDTTPNELLSDCIPLNDKDKKTFIIEMQRSLSSNEREFLYAFQSVMDKYLEEK